MALGEADILNLTTGTEGCYLTASSRCTYAMRTQVSGTGFKKHIVHKKMPATILFGQLYITLRVGWCRQRTVLTQGGWGKQKMVRYRRAVSRQALGNRNN